MCHLPSRPTPRRTAPPSRTSRPTGPTAASSRRSSTRSRTTSSRSSARATRRRTSSALCRSGGGSSSARRSARRAARSRQTAVGRRAPPARPPPRDRRADHQKERSGLPSPPQAFEDAFGVPQLLDPDDPDFMEDMSDEKCMIPCVRRSRRSRGGGLPRSGDCAPSRAPTAVAAVGVATGRGFVLPSRRRRRRVGVPVSAMRACGGGGGTLHVRRARKKTQTQT